MEPEEDRGEDEEIPWLREMVEDDLLGLFSDTSEEVARTARILVARAADDSTVTERLIEALRTSIERQNDDTQASIWMALLLGEIRDISALPVLFLGLGGDDEALQEASGDALLKIGARAIEALMDEFDEEPGLELTEAAYRLLGSVGSLKDPALRERTMDFLAERVDREAAKPPGERCIESLFQASALLGDRRTLAAMDRILRERFGGNNPAIRDSREMLLENAEGVPLVCDRPPWVAAYRWLFEEDPQASRVKGRLGGEKTTPPEENPEESRLSNLYWGLSTTLDRSGKEPLDARRFIGNPGEEEEEEEEEA